MSDPIKHECGIAHLRLRKSLQYYIDKYGTTLYGANKLRLEVKKKIGPVLFFGPGPVPYYSDPCARCSIIIL